MSDEVVQRVYERVDTSKLCELCGAPATREYRAFVEDYVVGERVERVRERKMLCRPHALLHVDSFRSIGSFVKESRLVD